MKDLPFFVTIFDMNINDLSAYRYPLRKDVDLFVKAGLFDQASSLIDSVIGNVDPYQRERLLLEKRLFPIREWDFPYDEQQALSLARENDSSMTMERLRLFAKEGAFPVSLIDGKVHYHRRFMDTLEKDHPSKEQLEDINLREQVCGKMSNYRHSEAEMTVHIGLRLKDDAVVEGKPVNVELPLPIISPFMQGLKIARQSGDLVGCDGEKSRMRRAHFRGNAEKGKEFWIEYSFTNTLSYHALDIGIPLSEDKPKKMREEVPYLVRTPYLESLANDICKDEKNLLRKAWLIYSYVTKQVGYSYMPSYQTLENLAEYGAMMRKGDCGIMACLFICLCRISGIQADWMGGMYVTPHGISNHDWASFRIPGLDTWYADCSFGGSALRRGDEKQWKYYFGNLDVMRIPCTNALARWKERQDGFWRNDPTDNQNGEAFYDDHPLSYDDLIDTRRTVSFKLS